MEPSENQAEAQPGEEHTLELPEVVLPEEQPVLPEEEALQKELFGEKRDTSMSKEEIQSVERMKQNEKTV